MTVIWSLSEKAFAKIPQSRPYVILNATMTLDGKIATKTRDSKISCLADFQRVHVLRASVNAVMVGIGTVLTDNPRLTVRLVNGRNPVKVIVDSVARTPMDSRVLTENKSTPTIIAVSEKAPREKVETLKTKGATIIIAGSGEHVDLKLLMRKLREMGIKTLMLEGGATLNWAMLKERLVDEIRVAIAPIVVGGKDAITFVEGEGISMISRGIKLKLECVEQYGEDLVLKYRVLTHSCLSVNENGYDTKGSIINRRSLK
jgi:2,5-diamino-6-(ribosylamino)-4(3H)-pyrimidinone 5'-phosphate reductase